MPKKYMSKKKSLFTERECSACKITKPRSDFLKPNNKSGVIRSKYCNDCFLLRRKEQAIRYEISRKENKKPTKLSRNRKE